MTNLDSPIHKVNRDYNYSNIFSEEREEKKFICEFVENGFISSAQVKIIKGGRIFFVLYCG